MDGSNFISGVQLAHGLVRTATFDRQPDTTKAQSAVVDPCQLCRTQRKALAPMLLPAILDVGDAVRPYIRDRDDRVENAVPFPIPVADEPLCARKGLWRRGWGRCRSRLRLLKDALAQKEKWPEHKVPAKFEQGGFTSRRRKDPKTLFPRTSLGNPCGHRPAKTHGDNVARPEHGPRTGGLPAGIRPVSSAKKAMLSNRQYLPRLVAGELIRSVAFPCMG